ncbi:MAG: serine/threonine-protein kinase, partial [Acidimicrobiales bacterium]
MADRSPGDRAVELGIPGYTDAVEIGRGGFGVVYRAQQPDFNRTVAIKLLLGGHLDEQSRQRFDRERRIMGTLSDHPNIVTVFGWGFTPGSQPYIAMAYMARGSLADRLDRKGPLGWQEAAQVGVKLANALEAAHRAKVMHRDLKPENVLVSAYGEPTLADFGIARVEGGMETVGGMVTASVAHAAPEVLSGQQATVASDIYGLGSTILTLMLGRPAFQREGDESILPMMARIGADPVPDLRPQGVPDAICRVLERAMAKAQEQRPASAAGFGRELQLALDRAGRDNPRQTVMGARRMPSVPIAPPPPPMVPGAPSAPAPKPPGVRPDDHSRPIAGKGPEPASQNGDRIRTTNEASRRFGPPPPPPGTPPGGARPTSEVV